MSVCKVLCWPDARLASPCDPIGDIAAVAPLVADLFETMYAAPGRGLAAPQVGVPGRIFVMDAGWKDGAKTPRACINPEILWSSEAHVALDEGCLSIPGITVTLSRPAEITLRYTTPTGDRREAHLTGAEARIAQHEQDHLDGRVTLDRLDARARDAALAAYAAQ
ncbi:peptide deformylase [Roseivivax sp. CAU 1753]